MVFLAREVLFANSVLLPCKKHQIVSRNETRRESMYQSLTDQFCGKEYTFEIEYPRIGHGPNWERRYTC